MSNDNSEFNAKVKNFINSLNPEQKKALYSKLSTMPEEKSNSPTKTDITPLVIKA